MKCNDEDRSSLDFLTILTNGNPTSHKTFEFSKIAFQITSDAFCWHPFWFDLKKNLNDLARSCIDYEPKMNANADSEELVGCKLTRC